ncbi:hypothetical protein AgCh_020532 [Apium graveolens]
MLRQMNRTNDLSVLESMADEVIECNGEWSCFDGIQPKGDDDMLGAKCYSYSHHEVLKCNDDTCIRVDTVMKELEKVSGKRLLYMGNHNLLHRPLRSGNCHFSKGFKRCLNIRVDHDLQKVWTLGKGLLYLKYHQRYQGQFGAVLASIPFPLFAALYCVLFGLVVQCILEHNILITSSPPTIGLIVAGVLDNRLDLEKSKKNRGMPWWVKFRTFRGDNRNEGFYTLPFKLKRFFPPT